ncbi:MAG: energy transducer TonB [Deltaproteobacteria bacterium]|nr:energy transducer TonB [Deltaproteobacteria bacterium]
MKMEKNKTGKNRLLPFILLSVLLHIGPFIYLARHGATMNHAAEGDAVRIDAITVSLSAYPGTSSSAVPGPPGKAGWASGPPVSKGLKSTSPFKAPVDIVGINGEKAGETPSTPLTPMTAELPLNPETPTGTPANGLAAQAQAGVGLDAADGNAGWRAGNGAGNNVDATGAGTYGGGYGQGEGAMGNGGYPGAGGRGTGRGWGTGRGKGETMGDYVTIVHEAIRRNTYYPMTARRSGKEGRVVTDFLIKNDGTVGAIRVVSSSGSNALDDAAVSIISRSIPFPAPPVAGLRVEVPLVFSLKDAAN